jgi:hypothetical protein
MNSFKMRGTSMNTLTRYLRKKLASVLEIWMGLVYPGEYDEDTPDHEFWYEGNTQLRKDRSALIQKLMACSAKRKAERRRERVLLSCCDYVLQCYSQQPDELNTAMQYLAAELQVYSKTERVNYIDLVQEEGSDERD